MNTLQKKGFLLASKLPEPQVSLENSLNMPNSRTMSFKAILDEEIAKIIQDFLKTYKSVGHDDLHAVLIKWAAPILIPILNCIFTKFVELGSYPNFFKIAKVTALHKGGSLSDIVQYQFCHILIKSLKRLSMRG